MSPEAPIPLSMTEKRLSNYYFDFANAYDTGYGETISGLAGSYIRAMNLKTDVVVGHYLHRPDPEHHHREYPLVPSVAENLQRPYLMVYENQQDGEVRFNGKYPAGRATLVTDVVRTGDTLVRTADYIREFNPDVDIRHAFALVVRPSGRRRKELVTRLEDEGIHLSYIITSQELVEDLYKKRYINTKQREEVMRDEDFEDPDSISKSMLRYINIFAKMLG